jgi:hypothetical protein
LLCEIAFILYTRVYLQYFLRLKYKMAPKCNIYFQKGVEAGMLEGKMTSQNMAACNIYRIQKGIKAPGLGKGGRRGTRKASRRAGRFANMERRNERRASRRASRRNNRFANERRASRRNNRFANERRASRRND